ncbi:mariner Mos1 transposase [Trichonephila clavipes]|nr:mariner Mos1 transposase [Trichonephila clavipes]
MTGGHTGSRPWLRKARQVLSARKLMVTFFWDTQEILLIEFMTRGTTINSEVYCRKLKKLKRAIHNKRRGLLSSGVALLHDNARPLLVPSVASWNFGSPHLNPQKDIPLISFSAMETGKKYPLVLESFPYAFFSI